MSADYAYELELVKLIEPLGQLGIVDNVLIPHHYFIIFITICFKVIRKGYRFQTKTKFNTEIG